MRLAVVLAPLALVAFAGCLDAPRPAGGTSCGTLAPTVRLRAVDVTTAVALPFTATVDGAPPMDAQCVDAANEIVSATPCTGELDFLLEGAATVVVSGDGYAPSTFPLDGGEPPPGAACGGPTSDFDLTVPLSAR